MDVKLISTDTDLYKLCRETLGEMPGHDWAITAVETVESDLTGDLYLWDFHPELLLPAHIFTSPSRHLFLVHRPVHGFLK